MISARGTSASAGSGSGTTINATWTPADAQVGDLGVIMVATKETLTQTVTPPAGWNGKVEDGGNGTNPIFVAVYARTLDSGDLGATTFPFTLAVSASYVWAMMIYVGAEIALVGAGSSTHSTADGFTMSAPPETTASPGSWVLELFGAETSNAAIAPDWSAAPSSTGSPASFVDRGGGVAVTDGVNSLGWYDADAGAFIGTTGTVTLPISSAAACSWVGGTVILTPPAGWGVGQIRMGTS